MVRLMKGSVIMDVNEDIASVFKENGYVEVAEKSAVSQPAMEEKTEDVKSTDYTKSDILRMKTEDLKVLAVQLGFEVTEESTGKALKEEIVSKLAL